MRIVFIGVGGVGGYIGAKFLHVKMKYDITLIGRGAHKEAIMGSGLTIVEDTQTLNVPVKNMSLEGIYDLVIFAVKSYDLQEAVEMIRPFVTCKSILIAFANGVSHRETIEKQIEAKVLDGAVYILSHLQEAGIIRKKGNIFAAVIGSEKYKKEVLILENLFKEADLRVKTPENIEEAIWKKYLFISAFATLTSYYDCSISSVYETQREECELLLQEIASVAKAKGIMLDTEVSKALQTASKVPSDASTSMHLDFQTNHKNELETLTYYIIEQGLELGVKTPLYEKMYLALKAKSS